MGNFVGKAMEENMTRNQDFMKEINRSQFHQKCNDISAAKLWCPDTW